MAVGLRPVKMSLLADNFTCTWALKFMATRYRFGDSEYPHFITFAVINWIDALSRPEYKEIIINSLKHCQQEKGLIINGWIIMSNHVHLIARSKPGLQLPDIMRELTDKTKGSY